MRETEIVLNLGGTQLIVSSAVGAWIEKMRDAFEPLLASGASEPHPDFSLTIAEATIAAPTGGLPLTWEGRLTDGNHGRIHENDTGLILEVESGGVLIIDHAARVARAYFKPGAYSKFFGNALMLVVDAALSVGGQQLVHAACLVERASNLAILICAPSGGGKTTTSLALAHSGFALMTDDASIVVPGAGALRAWGLPRALKVHRQTAKLLPWLRILPDKWDEAGEQGVQYEKLSGSIEVAAPTAAQLGAIFLLGPRAAGPHRIAAMRKPELLIAMAHENVAWRPAGMVPRAVVKFKALAEAVARVPAYSLNVAPELATLPALLSDTLRSQ